MSSCLPLFLSAAALPPLRFSPSVSLSLSPTLPALLPPLPLPLSPSFSSSASLLALDVTEAAAEATLLADWLPFTSWR